MENLAITHGGCNSASQEVVNEDLHLPMEKSLAITHGGCNSASQEVVNEDLHLPMENLAIDNSPKPVNPFPSLPTPSDVQDLQQDHHSGAMINLVPHPTVYSKQMPCYTAPPHCDDPEKVMIPGLGSPRPPIPPLVKDGKLIL